MSHRRFMLLLFACAAVFLAGRLTGKAPDKSRGPGRKVADLFGAKRRPEAFVLDGARNVVYDGRIDDQFGVGYRRPGKPTRRDLAEAVDAVLAGKPVSVAETSVAGCLINRAKKTAS